jgi:hypothetical protein
MLNNVVGYWAYILGGLIFGGLIFGGLIFGWAYIRGGGAYSRRFTVYFVQNSWTRNIVIIFTNCGVFLLELKYI